MPLASAINRLSCKKEWETTLLDEGCSEGDNQTMWIHECHKGRPLVSDLKEGERNEYFKEEAEAKEKAKKQTPKKEKKKQACYLHARP